MGPTEHNLRAQMELRRVRCNTNVFQHCVVGGVRIRSLLGGGLLASWLGDW